MKVDWESGTVEEMDDNEILLFNHYQSCSVINGLSRDWLPYTPEFDQLHTKYQRESGKTLSQRDLWRQLCRLLKPGVSNIQFYLRRRGL